MVSKSPLMYRKQGSNRIAFVSNTSWSIYNFRFGIIQCLLSDGYEIHAVAPKDDYSDKLIAMGCIFHPIKMDLFGTNPLRDVTLLNALLKNYKKFRYDLIFHFTIKPNIYGALVARLLGHKYVSVTTGLGRMFDLKYKWMSSLTLFLFKWANKKNQEMWFLNNFDFRVLRRYNVLTSKQTFIMPSEGVNTQRFISTRETTNSGLRRFLFAGRLLREKGIYEFVAAAKYIQAKYSWTRFEVLGFMEYQNDHSISYEQMHEWQEQGWIKYLGSVEDVRPHINRTDCVVHPSYYREGISRILLEAASMSKVIITSDNHGCKEIVEDGWNGFICKKRSINDLIDQIEKVLKLEPWEFQLFGGRSRNFVKANFDEQKVIEFYKTRLAYHFPKIQHPKSREVSKSEIYQS